MTDAEFWNTTLRALMLRHDGFRRAQERKEQSDWERARWIATAMLQPYAPKGRSIKPRDLAKFPWDGEKAQVRVTLTDAEKERLRKWDNN